MLTVYHYPACSTCKRAIKWMKAQGVAVEVVDIVAQPPAVSVLAAAARVVGVKKLFNVAGESYRAGGFKDKLATMSDAQAFAALAADGKLIKRPLVVGDGVVLVGFDEAAWATALRC